MAPAVLLLHPAVGFLDLAAAGLDVIACAVLDGIRFLLFTRQIHGWEDDQQGAAAISVYLHREQQVNPTASFSKKANTDLLSR